MPQTTSFFASVLSTLLAFGIPSVAFAQESLKPNVTSQEESSQFDPEKNSDGQSKDKTTGFYVEYLNYEEYVYSRSRKTEIGDQLELDTALRYQYSPSTFGRFRFLTDPVENRFDNKTSRFEFLAGHVYQNFYFQIDAELLTDDESDDGNSSGISIGMDLDSEDTRISYQFSDGWLFTFYPFNFDGEVGHEFNTWDVTRIYYIDGSPTTVAVSPTNGEKIVEKTLGGFELAYKTNPHKNEGLVLAAGIGAATYQYPGNANYSLEATSPAPASSRWERREDIGYKGLFQYSTDDFRIEGKYVTHTRSEETGSLLESAGSVYTIGEFGNLVLEAEVTMSKAGEAPYRIDKTTNWFEETSPWQPVYKDIAGNRQGWIGETDYAYALKAGIRFGDVTPYLTYRHQGEHFIFRERESAHLLRTNDESQSHGGLNRIGVGSYFHSGNFVVNPEFEYLIAENAVFSNASDVRNDRQNASFVKEDFLVYLIVRYQFDGPKLFQP